MTTYIPDQGEGVRVDIACGQIKGGRSTRWAVRCSDCGWLRDSYPSKTKAVYMANIHRESH